MTAVVIIDDLPDTGLIPNGGAERMAGTGTNEPVTPPAFLDLMERHLGQQRAVIVMYPSWSPAHSKKLVRLARYVLNTDRIAGMRFDLPPLALSLVADQLAFLSSYVSPGVLASLGQRLATEIVAGAWLKSVAGLDHFNINFGQHVSSYMPGGFMVTAAPTKVVHRITGSQPVGEIPARPADPIRLLVSGDGGDRKWVEKRLVPALKPAGVTPVQPQPLGPKFWGGKKYVEFVAFSTHPQALTRALHATPCRPCGWCHEPTALADCPFCGMHQRWADMAAEAVEPAAPAPAAADPAGPTRPVSAPSPPRPAERPSAPGRAAAQPASETPWWASGQPGAGPEQEKPWWESSDTSSGTAKPPATQPSPPAAQPPASNAEDVGATQPSRIAQGIVIPPGHQPYSPAPVPPHPGDRRVAGGPPQGRSDPEETQRVVPRAAPANGMAIGDLLAAGEAAASERPDRDYFEPARKAGPPVETE